MSRASIAETTGTREGVLGKFKEGWVPGLGSITMEGPATQVPALSMEEAAHVPRGGLGRAVTPTLSARERSFTAAGRYAGVPTATKPAGQSVHAMRTINPAANSDIRASCCGNAARQLSLFPLSDLASSLHTARLGWRRQERIEATTPLLPALGLGCVFVRDLSHLSL